MPSPSRVIGRVPGSCSTAQGCAVGSRPPGCVCVRGNVAIVAIVLATPMEQEGLVTPRLMSIESMEGEYMSPRVLVTGAKSGIGAAVCTLLEERGSEVVRADVVEGVGILALDVADEAAWERVLEESWPLTGVVNCAGVRTRAPLIELPVEEFDRLMAIHARGSFLAVRCPARRWLAEGTTGSVVTIASVVATHAVPGQIHYVASKTAVAGVVRAAAAELAHAGIRVNAIAPGVIRTPMTVDRLSDPEQHEWLKRRVPAERVGEPIEIAEAVVWLLSDATAYVNGVVLPVDGAWTAT